MAPERLSHPPIVTVTGGFRGRGAGRAWDSEIDELRSAGPYRDEDRIRTPQSGGIGPSAGRALINTCSINYLGLADHRQILAAAREALDRWGFGMASVRFIRGTQEIHHALERRVSPHLRS
jgi:glycine C-acetyltransferase